MDEFNYHARLPPSCTHIHTHVQTYIHMRNIRSGLPCLLVLPHVSFYFAPKFSPTLLCYTTQSAPFRKKRIENQIDNDSSSVLLVDVVRTFICMCALVFSEAVSKQTRNTLTKNIWCFALKVLLISETKC